MKGERKEDQGEGCRGDGGEREISIGGARTGTGAGGDSC